MLVTVVPMLAPMIIGTASWTPSRLEATRPTIVAVVTDEDCTSTVAQHAHEQPDHRIGDVVEERFGEVGAETLDAPSSIFTPTRNR